MTFTPSNAHGAEHRFGEGNTKAQTHGAYSMRTLNERAVQLMAQAIQATPWLGDHTWRPTLESWARKRGRHTPHSRSCPSAPSHWATRSSIFGIDARMSRVRCAVKARA